MLCPLCKQEINENSKFCGKCGGKIPRCPTCDTVINNRMKFCVNDGTRIPETLLSLFPDYENAEKKNVVNIDEEFINELHEISETEIAPAQQVTKPALFCVKCGKKCAEGKALCDNCETLINEPFDPPIRSIYDFSNEEEDSPKTHFCLNCGRTVYDNEPLCRECRTNTQNDDTQDIEQINISEKKRHFVPVLIAVISVLVVLAIGLGCFFLFGDIIKEKLNFGNHSESSDETSSFVDRTNDDEEERDSDTSGKKTDFYFADSNEIEDDEDNERVSSKTLGSDSDSELNDKTSSALSSNTSSKTSSSVSSNTSSAEVSSKKVESNSSAGSSPNVVSSQASVESKTNEEFIFADSNSRYLSKSELYSLSKSELKIARNEIYARYGRKFDDTSLQEHFNSCSWYKGTVSPSDFNDNVFNAYEKANINLIVNYENECDYR